jgi:hypothetical protein
MRRAYNRDLTNPEYLRVLNKTYSTKERFQGHGSFRETRYGYNKIQGSFAEKLTKVSSYFQHFTFTIDGSLSGSK